MHPYSDRPTATAGTPDLDLLRKFEPVVRFTKGEQFFPMDVDRYVRECSLWAHYPDGREEVVVKQGELTLENLVQQRPAVFGTVRFLRFIETLTLSEAAIALTEQANCGASWAIISTSAWAAWRAAVSCPAWLMHSSPSPFLTARQGILRHCRGGRDRLPAHA